MELLGEKKSKHKILKFDNLVLIWNKWFFCRIFLQQLDRSGCLEANAIVHVVGLYTIIIFVSNKHLLYVPTQKMHFDDKL